MEMQLKYGNNPHQKPAKVSVPGAQMPIKVLNGSLGFINILDALSGWQLVRELKQATGSPAAASLKHTSPAGAAIALPLAPDFLRSQFIEEKDLSPVATAYIRARAGDRMCSFGDAAAISDIVDASLARVLAREVCDLVIAPGYTPEALDILKSKRKGRFLILEIDPSFEPTGPEVRDCFGFTLEQPRNTYAINKDLFQKPVTQKTKVTGTEMASLITATIALKYTLSNSICLAWDGQVIGAGAGQQSRVHCVRLACAKAEKWMLQQHPKTLGLKFRPGRKSPEKANAVDQYLLWDDLSEAEQRVLVGSLEAKPEPLQQGERREWFKNFPGICLSSDAFFPFRDSIDRASRTSVRCLAQAGGSLRDGDVTAAADEYGMVMFHTGLRLFTH